MGMLAWHHELRALCLPLHLPRVVCPVAEAPALKLPRYTLGLSGDHGSRPCPHHRSGSMQLPLHGTACLTPAPILEVRPDSQTKACSRERAFARTDDKAWL